MFSAYCVCLSLVFFLWFYELWKNLFKFGRKSRFITWIEGCDFIDFLRYQWLGWICRLWGEVVRNWIEFSSAHVCVRGVEYIKSCWKCDFWMKRTRVYGWLVCWCIWLGSCYGVLRLACLSTVGSGKGASWLILRELECARDMNLGFVMGVLAIRANWTRESIELGTI